MKKSLTILLTLLLATYMFSDEGMFPLSELHKQQLEKKGLQIPVSKIYNPDGISLIDAIVRVGGCTGSFVSKEGLILTNHHCAYGAAQAASDANHDYIRNGFAAADRSMEIPAKGYTVRITDSYKDVSDEVLSVVKESMSFEERTRAVEKKIKEIVKKAEADHPGKRAEVSEMFIGKTYILFLYTYLKDIRLVYVPPRSIGEFGGEEDNWIWPRHTGDFSFMRAYVGKNGEPAEYSKDNIPYTPKTWLHINPDGVNEEDFVFILGYPGRTYRHRTSYFMEYEETVRMPYVVDLYDWEIETMLRIGKKDRAVAIKHLSRIKGLANVTKNYKGKLKGLKNLQLVQQKRVEEEKILDFMKKDSKYKKDLSIFNDIKEVYAKMAQTAPRNYLLNYIRRSVYLLRFALTAVEASYERQKPDLERDWSYMDRNFNRSKKWLRLMENNFYPETDLIFLREFLSRNRQLRDNDRIKALTEFEEKYANESSLEEIIKTSKLTDYDYLMDLLNKNPDELKKNNDPFIQLAFQLYPEYQKLQKIGKARNGQLDKLLGRLIEIKKEWSGADFIPDANSTLRLTFGHIRGYTPRDAVYYKPITTVQGVLEKSTGEEPFDTPPELIKLINQKQFGRFENPTIGSVPVGILYDMDTTGGNSGSPVLDAGGRLIGLNFDRAFEATINDYAWSESYSRSIGVDIRYVLWVTKYFGHMNDLMKELGVE